MISEIYGIKHLNCAKEDVVCRGCFLFAFGRKQIKGFIDCFGYNYSMSLFTKVAFIDLN